MFNGSRFNGVAYNAGSGGVRVLLASAVLAASTHAIAEPLRTQYGNTDAPVTASIHKPMAIADRAAAAIGYPQAFFEPGRPWDLAESGFFSESSLEPRHLVTRAGVSLMDAASFLSAESIRYAFFSDLSAQAGFDPIIAWGIRHGDTDIQATSGVEATATKEHPGRSSLHVSAIASFDADIFAGGITKLDPWSHLFAEAHLNGKQPGYSAIDVLSSLDAYGDRVAGAQVNGLVQSDFYAQPLPGRGAVVNPGTVTASLKAVWWAFSYESADLEASAELSASPMVIAAGRAELIAAALTEARWSLIVEPKQTLAVSAASLTATPWRIRSVLADALVTVGMSAEANRVYRLDVALSAEARITRSRLSVNLTDPAPEQRQMTITDAERSMVAPYENRTMVVT